MLQLQSHSVSLSKLVSHFQITSKLAASGNIIDSGQEMIALGIANIFGSFFQSMPTCGAFTRSAVSSASGVQTTFAGVYSALMAVLSLTLLTPYFSYIPKTTLAAILICAVAFMVEIVKCTYQFLYSHLRNCRWTLTSHRDSGSSAKLISWHGWAAYSCASVTA